jgi:hypothetical protein
MNRFWVKNSDKRRNKSNWFMAQQFDLKHQPGQRMDYPLFSSSDLELLGKILDMPPSTEAAETIYYGVRNTLIIE